MEQKTYYFLLREFAPTAGSGISEPKPTDRAKVKIPPPPQKKKKREMKYNFSIFSGASRHWQPDVNLCH